MLLKWLFRLVFGLTIVFAQSSIEVIDNNLVFLVNNGSSRIGTPLLKPFSYIAHPPHPPRVRFLIFVMFFVLHW